MPKDAIGQWETSVAVMLVMSSTAVALLAWGETGSRDKEWHRPPVAAACSLFLGRRFPYSGL